MLETLDFEDELQKLLKESGEDLKDGQHGPAAVPAPVPAPHLEPADQSKERVLSQAEIDALLASFNQG
jgi:hypothetical protein